MSYEGDYPREERHHHHQRRNEDEEGGGYGGGGGGYGGGDGGYGDRPAPIQGGGGGGYDQGYGSSEYGGSYGQQPVVQTDVYRTVQPTDDGGITATEVKVTRHKREEEAAGLGGLAAGAFALYEGHEAKKDPEHALRHKREEEAAAAAAVGAEGFAWHERHEKREGRKEEAEEERLAAGEPEKKHHFW